MPTLKSTTILAGALLAFTSLKLANHGAIAAEAAPAISPAIAAAVADAGRPATDTARDADRKPAEMVAFAGLKAGDKVADLVPGGGYFTRVFSKTVGAKGKVYAVVPDILVKNNAKATDGISKLAADPAYNNVSVVVTPLYDLKLPEPLDVAWTSDNYHDFHNPMFGSPDMGAYNKSVFNTLKSGGIYIVIDHSAVIGAGTGATETLHRIDPESVKAEVTGVGFEFVGETNILAHPGDDHTTKIFETGVRGKTDQFVLKFRKP